MKQSEIENAIRENLDNLPEEERREFLKGILETILFRCHSTGAAYVGNVLAQLLSNADSIRKRSGQDMLLELIELKIDGNTSEVFLKGTDFLVTWRYNHL